MIVNKTEAALPVCWQVGACGRHSLGARWEKWLLVLKRLPLSRKLTSSHWNYNNTGLGLIKNHSSILVFELVCVSIHPVLWREGHFIEVAAVMITFTGLDKHDRPLEMLSIRTDKGHRYGACAAWWAAPLVCTHTTVVGPVAADTHTFCVGQMDGLWGFVGRGTLSPSLWLDEKHKEMSVILWSVIGLS